jgi:hypothetical protein
MRKSLVAAAIAVGVMTPLAGCGGAAAYPSATYCVDQVGHVVSPNYCDSGYMGGSYMLFVGSVHSHTYRVGQTIPRSYITSGREIRPSDTAARKSAGLPFSGSVSNGTKPAPSKPAAPQQAPKSPSAPFGGSTKATKPSTSTRSTGGFSGSTSRSSSSSSSRSSSSGGRK